MNKEDFIKDNVYSKIFNCIYYFLMMNIYFGITNLLLLIVIRFFTFDGQHILVYAFSLIPTAPAFVALTSCLNKYYREKDLDITRDFFGSYKYFFKKSMVVWLFSLTILTIIALDYFFLMKTKYIVVFTPILFLTFYIVLITNINYSCFLVKNREASIKDLLRISVFYTFKKFYLGIVNLIVILSLFFITVLKPVLGMLCLQSIFAYLIYLNNNHLHKTTPQ